jgi:hypothetical protein
LWLHLLPFFGNMGLSEVSLGAAQDYRVHWIEKTRERKGKPPGSLPLGSAN